MPSESVKSGRMSGKYRVKSRTSQVDETLFSSNTQEILRKNRENGPRTTKNKPKETVTIITKDLIRTIPVPREDPSGKSMVIPRGHFQRIKNSSRVCSQSEIEREAALRQREREEVSEAAADRKAHFKELDMERANQHQLNDLELEAKKENEHLLEQANSLRLEQEDTVKKLNELILNAKCHAIRDAQIDEVEEIKNEMDEENKRLDIMMEVHRLNGIKEAERLEKQKRIQRREGAREILEQIKLNTETRLLDGERKNAEAQALVQYMKQLQDDDIKDLEKRKHKQEELLHEINEINRQAQLTKERRMEQERIQDAKVVEYNRLKAERESEIEAEQLAAKAAKEKETQRLRGLQERAQDHRAAQDALRAKRNLEEQERAWRRKEKIEAEKKAQIDAEMRAARTHQIKDKLHFQAVQAHRERAEFERVLQAQETKILKEEEEKQKKHQILNVHSQQLRQQIENREQHRIDERRAFFKETEEAEKEQLEHQEKLNEVVQKKLDELRKVGIDQKYINEVVRKMNQPKRLTD